PRLRAFPPDRTGPGGPGAPPPRRGRPGLASGRDSRGDRGAQMVTDRPTTSRRGRAWVPAVVGAGFVAVLLFASSLVREVLDDRNVDRFGEGHLHMFVLNAMAPIGRPGIVVDGPGGDTVDLLLSLAAVALVVLVLTWLVSLAARDLAGAVTVLVGTWLATALGVALG